MSASQLAQGKEAPYYYVPAESVHPVRARISLLMALLGAALWINSYAAGFWLFFAGILCLFVVLFGWFGDAKIGRTSWWERVCKYVKLSVVAGPLKKK